MIYKAIFHHCLKQLKMVGYLIRYPACVFSDSRYYPFWFFPTIVLSAVQGAIIEVTFYNSETTIPIQNYFLIPVVIFTRNVLNSGIFSGIMYAIMILSKQETRYGTFRFLFCTVSLSHVVMVFHDAASLSIGLINHSLYQSAFVGGASFLSPASYLAGFSLPPFFLWVAEKITFFQIWNLMLIVIGISVWNRMHVVKSMAIAGAGWLLLQSLSFVFRTSIKVLLQNI